MNLGDLPAKVANYSLLVVIPIGLVSFIILKVQINKQKIRSLFKNTRKKTVYYFKNWALLSFLLIGASVVGVFGIFFFKEDNPFKFIFESLAWFPLELIVMLLFVERIINKNNEKATFIREYKDYIDVADEDLYDLLETFKLQMIQGITNSDSKDIKGDFEKIYNSLDKEITPENLRNGFQAPILDRKDPFGSIKNVKYARKSYIASMADSIKRICDDIDKHFERYLRYIPMDIFKELKVILKELDKDVLFGRYEMATLARQMVMTRENVMSDEEYEGLVTVIKNNYTVVYEQTKKIEELIENYNEKIS